MTARIKELLIKAGEALGDGRDPFCTDWLAEHSVTFDECRSLSNAMSMACVAFANGGKDHEEMVQAIWASHLAGLDPQFVLSQLYLKKAARLGVKLAEKALQDPDSNKE